MTPPEAPLESSKANQVEQPQAVSFRLETLRKRSDFMRASRAAHTATSGFVLQMRKRDPDEDVQSNLIRIGYTCSKKVGNAVARNRAKRRLREIARLVLPTHGLPARDYVLIGRKGATADLQFTQLQADLAKALAKLHRPKK